MHVHMHTCARRACLAGIHAGTPSRSAQMYGLPHAWAPANAPPLAPIPASLKLRILKISYADTHVDICMGTCM